ncbi:hypothetical protein N7451_007233 [Penicillium sp. IBT 35674x]|nr:hypothetical protein N7451_007233 [Penicillium sp. IBT 35674x]
MPSGGIPERAPDPLRYENDVPTTIRQQQPIWQSVDPVAISSSPKIVNRPPNPESRIPNAASQYNNTPFDVMHGAIPMPQEQTTRQRATPHELNQLKEQEHGLVSQTTLPPQILPWNHANLPGLDGHYRSHLPCDLPSEILKCHWKGCRYTGTFGRKAELERHIRTQHINPKAYKCPKCGRPCNRNDNLNGHLRNVHGTNIQVTQM